MTISNRAAAQAGKLGDDLLTMAAKQRESWATGETATGALIAEPATARRGLMPKLVGVPIVELALGEPLTHRLPVILGRDTCVFRVSLSNQGETAVWIQAHMPRRGPLPEGAVPFWCSPGSNSRRSSLTKYQFEIPFPRGSHLVASLMISAYVPVGDAIVALVDFCPFG